MAELLSDKNNISIKVVTFAGKDKTVMLKRTEYGMKCLISAVNEVLEYMNIINETETEIYNCIRENENITIPELSNEANVGERQVMRVLNKLKEKKYIKREGSNKKGFWKVL